MNWPEESVEQGRHNSIQDSRECGRLDAQTDIRKSRTAAYRIVWLQLGVAVGLAFLLLLFSSIESSYSALLGGLAYILPNAFFVRYAFRDSGRINPAVIVQRLYVGEAGKLVLTAIIFAACFIWVKPLQVLVLFATFIAMIIINLAGIARISTGQQQNINEE